MRILAASLAAVSGVAVLSGLFPAEGAPVPVGTYVYVHDRTADGRVHGFSLSPEGVLAALPGSPFQSAADGGSCGGYCETMAYSKKRKLLFVGGESGGIGVFRVLPGGAIEEVAGSPFGGVGIWGTGVVRKGKRTFVYGSDYSNDQVRGFQVQDDDTLVELPSSPFAAGDGPDGLAAVKNKVFAANELEGTVSSYVVASDGSLVPAGPPLVVGGVSFVYNVNPDPAGKYLYLGGCDQTVAAFQVLKTAALLPLPGSPFDSVVPTACAGVAVSKKHVVVPSDGNDALQVFLRRKGGILTAQGNVQNSSITGPKASGFHSRGRTLVVANEFQVQALALDPKTGVLTPGTPLDFSATNVNCLVVVRR